MEKKIFIIITSYNLQVTSYKLKLQVEATNCNIKFGYKLQVKVVSKDG
jgi:hypothetical protein